MNPKSSRIYITHVVWSGVNMRATRIEIDTYKAQGRSKGVGYQRRFRRKSGQMKKRIYFRCKARISKKMRDEW